MNGMSPEANQLVNAGRQAFGPTQADRARFMTAVTGVATLSMGAAVATSASRSFRGIFSMAHAARVLAIALPVAAAGGIWLYDKAPTPSGSQAGLSMHSPSLPAPKAVEPPPVPEVQVQLPEQPAAPAAAEGAPAERSVAPRSAAVADSSKRGRELREEVALLSKAQAALSRGRPQEALEALAEHTQRFPRGVLSEERAATRVRALCALGRTREAASELKRMENFNPTSAYLARARESCGF